MRFARILSAALLITFLSLSLSGQTAVSAPSKPVKAAAKAPAKKGTPAQAEKFVKDAEKDLLDLGIKASRTAWVQSTYITDDTEALAAEANEALTKRVTELAEESTKFDGLKLSYDVDRKLKLLKLALSVPAPKNDAERAELTKISVSMESDYGKGKYCPAGHKTPEGEPKCLSLGDMEKILAESRNPDELKEMWLGWHKISPPLKQRYSRFVDLANKGAREQGFQDVGALWRSNYDMPPDAFAAEMERLWQQVRPLYLSLHTYVRAQLVKKYGPNVVPADGPIPAHLLGNMWSQEWGNINDVVKPAQGDSGVDLTGILRKRNTDAKQMVRYGEGFFTSLGLQKLPDTFWQRSLFTKPQDRDVVCHASAWDIDSQQDVRIKMCIKITAEDFNTIHHELGHNYYQIAYAKQSPVYQNSANDGFHEALGDTIALSVTPEYLKKLGFIQTVPPADADISLLLEQAMDKVAFLPFGYLVDQWRWKVFSGDIKPADYNKSWWELRTRYQGIKPPAERSEADFDAGAKYHVAANVPYARYFLARILQFQFQRALCKEAGYTGPLHRCSIYGNRAAGERIEKMMAMGVSRPWPEALKALTGEDRMDATAMIDYFAPLKKWLDEQNKGQKSGW
ncbi:MAG TPA: M2 family metallopeptidase [Terriglobales bacterium]|nr:M2 family metallopeptidase [Terriglobales bacterium]